MSDSCTPQGLSIGSRYSIVSLVFFIPYIVFELPSNILIRKIGTRYWLASIGVAWGIIQIGMGFLKNWKQLVACRVLLGLLEVGRLSETAKNAFTDSVILQRRDSSLGSLSYLFAPAIRS
jgi:MFS family permease